MQGVGFSTGRRGSELVSPDTNRVINWEDDYIGLGLRVTHVTPLQGLELRPLPISQGVALG